MNNKFMIDFIKKSCDVPYKKYAFKKANRNPYEAEKFVIPFIKNEKMEEIIILIGFLYTNKVGVFDGGDSFGETFNRIPVKKLNKSLIKRFHNICRSRNYKEIIESIYRNVGLLKSFDSKLNLEKMIDDLVYWGNGGVGKRNVVRSWQRSFTNVLKVN